jgi:3-oxoadipate enol-lactonase
MYAEANEIRVNYHIDGCEDAPLVTFITGIANDTTMWDGRIRGTDPLGYFGCIAAFMTLNFQDRIHQISVPTLFISGADDQGGGPPDVMRELADVVPGARQVSVPNAAHICNIQNPEGYNGVLGNFLRG